MHSLDFEAGIPIDRTQISVVGKWLPTAACRSFVPPGIDPIAALRATITRPGGCARARSRVQSRSLIVTSLAPPSKVIIQFRRMSLPIRQE
jgi:hypothetical protein